jgi:hypothetical protein
MNADTRMLPGLEDRPLTAQDFEAVQALLREVSEDERTLALSKAVVAWLTALDIFRKLERRIGLPATAESRLIYGGIVGQLKGTGKWLLVATGQNPRLLENLSLTHDDLNARVRQLTWDDEWVENPLTETERASLDQMFGR